MKKFFAFAIAAVTMTVGCQKFQDLINPNDKPVDDGAPVPVVFGTNIATVATKAAINETAFPTNEKIYVYGLDNADYSSTEKLLLNNLEITSPNPSNETNAFYGVDGEKYSFYGYYVGTALTPEAEVSYSEGVITVPVTINGTQDLMIGLTDKAKDLGTTPGLTEADLYSAKSARKEVHPNLVFEHMLVRFDFEFDGSSILPSDATVTVESVSVTTNTTGNLVISHGNETPGALNTTGEATPLKIGDANAPLVKFGENAAEMADGAGTIMVMPKDAEADQSYAIALSLKQGEADAVSQNLTLTMPEGKSFEAGKKYAVKIKVYGMEAVIVDVTVKEWGEGGAFEYDPDENENPVYIPVMGETETIDFTAEASSQSFMFDAEGQTWTITKSENAEWLTVNPESEITANGKVIFTATANEGEGARTATVTITTGEGDSQKTKTVTINQAAPVVEPGE